MEETAASRLPRHASVRQPFTFTFKAAIQSFLYSFIRSFHGVLAPRLAIVAAQDHDLSLIVTEGGEVGNLNDHRAGGRDGSALDSSM